MNIIDKFIKDRAEQQVKALMKKELKSLLVFIDGERIIGADTKEEKINSQGKNQAYDIVVKFIQKRLENK